MNAIIHEPALCKTHGDEYAVVEIDGRGEWSEVLGKTVRVLDTARDLADAQERLKVWA